MSTVAGKIIDHIIEDHIEIQDPTNRKIIRLFYEGIQKGKIPTVQDLLALNDEDISQKIAGLLIEKVEEPAPIEGINFTKEEDDLVGITDFYILSHKKAYINKMLADKKRNTETLDFGSMIKLEALKENITKELIEI